MFSLRDSEKIYDKKDLRHFSCKNFEHLAEKTVWNLCRSVEKHYIGEI